jgi:hypothetical protein
VPKSCLRHHPRSRSESVAWVGAGSGRQSSGRQASYRSVGRGYGGAMCGNGDTDGLASGPPGAAAARRRDGALRGGGRRTHAECGARRG